MNERATAGEERWTEDKLRRTFAGSADVVIQTCRFGDAEEANVVLAYAEGMCSSPHIVEYVLPELDRLYAETGSFEQPGRRLSKALIVRELDGPEPDRLLESVFEGNLALLFADAGVICAVDLSVRPSRQPSESNTEISVKGPKDCFIEDIVVNMALIRKRIRSSSLHVDHFTIGRRTKTKISLLYFYDIANPDVVRNVKRRLSQIDIDGLFSINQLEEYLSGKRFKILPLMDFTGRPDFAVNSLLSGRFVILVDGVPMALIGPAALSLILKSPEDAHFNYSYVSFARIIRAISLLLSIFLPAFWVALMAFHQDQIPFRMMATISITRIGLPLSAHMEMFILLMLLEIFREAGVRLPSAIGQTLTSIGGLIIGDAAIRAGLVSPSVVVVGAITAVSGVTLVNQTLSTQVSILRLFFFVLSAFIGMYGVILGVVLLIAYMGSLRSFGVPYLAPLAPLSVRDFLPSFLRIPWELMRRRPTVLKQPDPDAQGDDRS